MIFLNYGRLDTLDLAERLHRDLIARDFAFGKTCSASAPAGIGMTKSSRDYWGFTGRRSFSGF
jgi:hypothetical protein